MYFGYGYPRVFATDVGKDEEWIFLMHGTDQHMLGITQTSVQLWSNGLHKLRLSSVVRPDDNVEQEGKHVAAFWSPAKAAIAILTDKGFLHIYNVHQTKEPVLPGSTAGRELYKADVYLRHTAKLDTAATALCITGDSKTLLLGCRDGSFVACTWTGKLRGDVVRPLQQEWAGDEVAGIRNMQHCEKTKSLVVVLTDGACAMLGIGAGGLTQVHEIAFSHWVCAPQMRAVCARIGASAQMVAVGCANGTIALYKLHKSGAGASSADILQPAADAPIRFLSLEPWGHRSQQTGSIQTVEWSPDCRAIAAGYSRQGVVVWSPSGCRLLCSLRQVPNLYGRDSIAGSTSLGRGSLSVEEGGVLVGQTSGTAGEPSAPPELDSNGVAALAWGPQGYILTVGHSGCSWQLSELQFAHSLPHHHRVSHAGPGWLAGSNATSSSSATAATTPSLPHHYQVLHGQQQLGEELHVLQAHDRLLVIAESIQATAAGYGSSAGKQQSKLGGLSTSTGPEAGSLGSDLLVSHVTLPYQYISANWPVLHAAVSSSGMDMAVAGRNGLALYSRASDRWRLFGDVSQEKRVSCCALNWLMDGIVLVCSGPRYDGTGRPASGSPAGYELLLFPRYHLDFASLLCRFPLTQPPLAVDCVGRHVLIASEPLEIALYEVTVKGQLTPMGKPSASLQLLREISMLDVGRPLLDVALVPASPAAQLSALAEAKAAAANGSKGGAKPTGLATALPRQCVLLRWGGLMSALDLEVGSEVMLAAEVEAFWLSDSLPVAPAPPSLPPSTQTSVAAGLDKLGQVQLQLPMAGASASIHNMPGQVSATTRALPLGHLVGEPTQAATTTTAPTASRSGPVAATVDRTAPTQRQGGLLEDTDAQQSEQAGLTPLLLGMQGVEMPWWSYGPQGMQLWFPSSLTQPLLPNASGGLLPAFSPQQPQQQSQQDIELEFDQEVYPIGISLADAAIVGVTQRVVRSPAVLGGRMPGQPAGPGPAPAASLPCFHPIPESQPVLPCLLRRLLQQNAFANALLLARRHEHGPHFSRSLEWLLFTALEMESSKPLVKRASIGAHGPADQFFLGRTPVGESHLKRSPSAFGTGGQMLPIAVSPLLMSAAELVRCFPALAADCIVAVARKTDAQLWPALFSAVGQPSLLLEGLLEAGALAAASCFLLCIDRLEGAAMAHTQALRLMRAALKRAQYPLVGELLRFVIPPGGGVDAAFGGEPGSPTTPRQAPASSPDTQGSPFAVKEAQNGVVEGQQGAQQGQQQGSWFGWLLGYPSKPDGSAAATLPVSMPAQGGASTGGAARASAGGEPGSLRSVASDSIAPAADARQMVAEHAWALLEAGRLFHLVQLSAAVSFLAGGLVTLMRSYPPSSDAIMTSRMAAPGPVELLSSLALVVTEYPVWSGERVEADAKVALELVKQLGAVPWVVVLSVVLVSLSDVKAFVTAHPAVWAEFVAQVKADKTFQYLWGIMDAVSPTPPASPAPSKSLLEAEITAPPAAPLPQQQATEQAS